MKIFFETAKPSTGSSTVNLATTCTIASNANCAAVTNLEKALDILN